MRPPRATRRLEPQLKLALPKPLWPKPRTPRRSRPMAQTPRQQSRQHPNQKLRPKAPLARQRRLLARLPHALPAARRRPPRPPLSPSKAQRPLPPNRCRLSSRQTNRPHRQHRNLLSRLNAHRQSRMTRPLEDYTINDPEAFAENLGKFVEQSGRVWAAYLRRARKAKLAPSKPMKWARSSRR
jgi:hypothetical protein